MRTLNDYFLTAEIEDISTASSTFVAVPDGGKIIKIITALQGAISGGNAALSFEIGGVAVTGGGITVAHSGEICLRPLFLYIKPSMGPLLGLQLKM